MNDFQSKQLLELRRQISGSNGFVQKRSVCSKIVFLTHTPGRKWKTNWRSRDFTSGGKSKIDENKHSLVDCVANLWFVCLIFCFPFDSMFVKTLLFERWWKRFSWFPLDNFDFREKNLFHWNCLWNVFLFFRESSQSETNDQFTKLAELPHSGYHRMTLSSLCCENKNSFGLKRRKDFRSFAA